MKVGLIGGGNMGEAILRGACRNFRIAVYEKRAVRRRYLKRKYPIEIFPIDKIIQWADIIIFAVKPQDISRVLMALQNRKREPLFISIAAGITTEYLERHLGGKPRVIRTMPNMPAMVKEGISALCRGRYAQRRDLNIAKRLFLTVGEVIIVEEQFMNAITAVSGSGPAYVFYFMEQMMAAASALGLNTKQARQLVQKTFQGSLHLLDMMKADPADLRARVTSKGGTTEAALRVFKKGRFPKIFQQALKAASQRAKELSK